MSDASPEPTAPSPPSNGFNNFFIPVASGVLGWLLATLLIGLIIGRGSEGEFFLAISENWMHAAGIGGFVLLTVGLLRMRNNKSTMSDFRLAVYAYVMPILVGWAAVLGFNQAFPQSMSDLDVLVGFLLLVFFLAGLVMAFLLRHRDRKEPFIGVAVPPILGILLIIGYTCVTIITSAEFIYRDAFVFTPQEVKLTNGRLEVTGTLEVRKEGDFDFEAPCGIFDFEGDRIPESGEITWLSIDTPPSTPGVYPLAIVWDDLPENLRSHFLYDPEMNASLFSLLIMTQTGDGSKKVALKSFGVPIPESSLQQ